MYDQICTAKFKLVMLMSNHDDCPVCGRKFGHAWGGIGRVQHMWHEHGIPGKATFNGHTVDFNDKSGVQKTTY